MWKETCDKLINLEKLENQFVEYYGEEHRDDIREKLSKTTFAFVPNNGDLEGFINLNMQRCVCGIFPKAEPLFCVDVCIDLINIIENNPEELDKNRKKIEILGYEPDELQAIVGGDAYAYGGFRKKLMEAKSDLAKFETSETKAYKSIKEQYKDFIADAKIGIDVTSLGNYVVNHYYLQELITANTSKLEEWENSFPKGYISMFNKCFGTNFTSFDELKKDNIYYNLALFIEKLCEEYQNKLQQFKDITIDPYIPSKDVSDRQVKNIKKNIKHNLKGKAAGLCYTYSDKILGITEDDLQQHVLIVLYEGTAYATIIHELTHVMQTNMRLSKINPKEISGFQVDDKSGAFNEIVTDFLAQRMVKQVLPKNASLPILKSYKSSYSEAFCLLKDFLLQNEKLLKECQFSRDAPKLLAKKIGKDNYKQLVLATHQFLNCNPDNHLTYISRQMRERSKDSSALLQGRNILYEDSSALLQDMDDLYEEFKDNKNILKFLHSVQALDDLNRNLKLTKDYSADLAV